MGSGPGGGLMRPRERYLSAGPDDLRDRDLLALILGTGTATCSANALALALMERFGDLPGLAAAEARELASVHGVGPARAVRVHAAVQLGVRVSRCSASPASPVCTVVDAAGHLAGPLRGLACEELHALYLDRRSRPLAHRTLTRGSDAYTVVDPRQVFRVAVRLGAASVILAHNHPSGDATPSAQDHDVTRRVDAAGRVIGVRLLDHLVVTARAVTSLAEQGTLAAWRAGPVTTGTR